MNVGSDGKLTQQQWIDGLAAFDGWNERLIMAAFAYFGTPHSYLDVGSGTGSMVNLARRLGVDAWGVDVLARPDDWLLTRDLREPLDLARRFDFVTSIEVAEHIPVENDVTIADTIARHVAPGGTLVFTAAHPGQGGAGHVNCRPGEYWRRMFWDRGLGYQEADTHRLALVWMAIPHPMGHLMDNLQVFRR